MKPKTPRTPNTPDHCPHCGAAINAASLLAQRPSPARAAAARRAATFPRPNRRQKMPRPQTTTQRHHDPASDKS
jgi:hypothetical protein